jgi:hypothetical protein
MTDTSYDRAPGEISITAEAQKRTLSDFGIYTIGLAQTFAPQKAMSALHPIATAKADFRTRPCLLCPKSGHVRCN